MKRAYRSDSSMRNAVIFGPSKPEPTDLESLGQFVVVNPELEELESILAKFNFFESIGAVHSELRHSDFLSFLLNPRETHGLSDSFLKLFLKKICSLDSARCELSSVEADVWDLNEIDVKRELENIDIVLVHEARKIICWIENKIDTREHSDQLSRYYDKIRAHYSDFKKVPIYLTPDGSIPSHEAYVPVDYGFIINLLSALSDSKKTTINSDVQIAIKHYQEMLGRHIVSDSKVAQLARQIYQKHSKALDIIFEHRPDLQLEINQYLIKLIEARPELESDRSSKNYIRFCASKWDGKDDFMTGEGWTPSKRLVLFEFKNYENLLRLYLIIGPGNPNIRKQVFSTCQADKSVFQKVAKTQTDKWTTVWTKTFLSEADYDKHSKETLFSVISTKFSQFLSEDLAAIERTLTKCFS